MAVIASEKSLLLPHTHEAGNAYLIGDIYDRLRAQTTQNAPFLRSYVAYVDCFCFQKPILTKHLLERQTPTIATFSVLLNTGQTSGI